MSMNAAHKAECLKLARRTAADIAATLGRAQVEAFINQSTREVTADALANARRIAELLSND